LMCVGNETLGIRVNLIRKSLHAPTETKSLMNLMAYCVWL